MIFPKSGSSSCFSIRTFKRRRDSESRKRKGRSYFRKRTTS